MIACPCSAVCDIDDTTITSIIVMDGSSFTANFVLDPGGWMAGTITDAATVPTGHLADCGNRGAAGVGISPLRAGAGVRFF